MGTIPPPLADETTVPFIPRLRLHINIRKQNPGRFLRLWLALVFLRRKALLMKWTHNHSSSLYLFLWSLFFVIKWIERKKWDGSWTLERKKYLLFSYPPNSLKIPSTFLDSCEVMTQKREKGPGFLMNFVAMYMEEEMQIVLGSS